ncbi:MAG TPA: hypothetical protein VN923_08360 [Thermoanaerobaculia bacterium]|nr:hypothetical protein [Thermoanaerobaculia bacterium]
MLALLPLAAMAAGTSSGETSPTPASGVADISGGWRGTSNWEQHAVHTIGAVTMALGQDDHAVSGTLTFASPSYQGWRGTISGTVAGTSPDTQFVGTIELRAPVAGGGTCTGSAVFSGRSVADSLRWETSQLRIPFDTEGQPDSACRGLLRNFVLILGRR